MASFTVDAALATQVIGKELDGLDEDVVEYLASMVGECDEPGREGVIELLAPFLESYGAADDEDAARALAEGLCDKLVDAGALTAIKTEAAEERKLALPVQMAADEGGEDDTWGLKSVKNKHLSNTTVESISEALGNKKSLERQQKKAEKERKREELKFEREEEQRRREMEDDVVVPAAVAPEKVKLTQALRNRSSDVHIENVNISVGGGKLLLEDATLKISEGRKYGLIGKNGTGKTTLLKHISRRQLESFPDYLSVVHVEQEVKANDMLVLDYVLKADTERERLLKEEERLLAQLETATDAVATNEALRKVYDELAAIGSESAEARARVVLTGLGFTGEMQTAPTSSLSGGWRMRVALATALFLSPDILLLDEPTNHLDVLSVLFLERYLQNYPKAFIVVSHDRVFTNNVINEVIHLENRQLNYYKGDIDIFEQTRENQRLQQQREFESQQAKRAHMQKFVDKFRYNAKRASLAQSRIKALNRMTLVNEVIDDPEFTFSFPEPISELSKVMEVQDVSFGYPGPDGAPGPMLFENVDMSVHTSSRIVVLGANGCGKSTFINLMLDKLQPVKGYVQREPKLRIGYFAQHHVDQLDVRQTPLEYLLGLFHGSKPDQVRSHLARYGIPAELAAQRIGTMSGGQKSRVAFAKITWERPHLLICDEPSNHLDLETNAALSIAFNTFEGGLVLVSHDQYLIEMCADEFWVMQDGKLFQFKGTFAEYKKWALPDV